MRADKIWRETDIDLELLSGHKMRKILKEMLGLNLLSNVYNCSDSYLL